MVIRCEEEVCSQHGFFRKNMKYSHEHKAQFKSRVVLRNNQAEQTHKVLR